MTFLFDSIVTSFYVIKIYAIDTVVIADIESLAAKKDVSVVPDTLSDAAEIRSSRRQI